jgi:hypothetical protein
MPSGFEMLDAPIQLSESAGDSHEVGYHLASSIATNIRQKPAMGKKEKRGGRRGNATASRHLQPHKE